MRTASIRLALGSCIALSVLGGVNFAQASSLTSTQVSAIISLLQSFGADQDIINNVSVALGGTSAPASQPCMDLPQDLTLGATGSDVTSLQNYLIGKGYLSGTTATGYYGYLTASAVGQLQLSLGIVSFQNDSAYGIMGPKTRAAVECRGSTQALIATLYAWPQNGQAPLIVDFNTRSAEVTTLYFGDGSPAVNLFDGHCSPDDCSAEHTYTSPGAFTATAYYFEMPYASTTIIVQ